MWVRKYANIHVYTHFSETVSVNQEHAHSQPQKLAVEMQQEKHFGGRVLICQSLTCLTMVTLEVKEEEGALQLIMQN